MRFATGVLSMLGVLATGHAADIFVPADHPTVQDAIDAASNGDRVFVSPGTWTGTGESVVDFRGKEINVRATGDAADTVLDGEGVRHVVLMTSGETASTSLEGFTVTRGIGVDGGGILIQNGSPVILNCTVRDNVATNHGGGIAAIGGSAVIRSCVIHQNEGDWGGGLFLRYGTPSVEDTTLSSNTADVGGGSCQHEVDAATWDACTFNANLAELGGGVFHLHHSDPIAVSTFQDCIFTGNHAVLYGGGIGLEWGALNIIDCQVTNNTAGQFGGGLNLLQTLTNVWNTTVCGNSPDQFGDVSSTTFHSFAFVGPDCPSPKGPCCVLGCTETTEADCLALGGTWLGEGSTCETCPPLCPSDANGDGVINIDDLLALLSLWGPCP